MILRIALVILVLAPQATAQDVPVASSLPPEARQFDFWIGEWDVNLRVRQDDLTWEDQTEAVAKVYPILNGKAVLELWSADRPSGIKGYSLRAFDPERNEWVLWLNWPGPNRSGSSSLAGSFRHGRAEFFAARRTADGEETISRYTFSDITPSSLRWDDAFSSDGGRTWRPNWIMEFTRTAAKPPLPPAGGPTHTFHDGDRCPDPRFRTYEFLSGRREGDVEVGGEGRLTIVGYRILDGCAVITFAGPEGDPERAFAFSHLTWNTTAERYELTTLTSNAGAPIRVFHSRGEELVFHERVEGDRVPDRFRIEENPDGSVTWVHETRDGAGWRPVWRATVGRG